VGKGQGATFLGGAPRGRNSEVDEQCLSRRFGKHNVFARQLSHDWTMQQRSRDEKLK